MFLLIDNYDSFTYNLYHYLCEAGALVEVRRNDKITVEEMGTLKPQGIILSPGPAAPDQAGICLAAVEYARETQTPLMGVCLGHQTIGQAFGGKVIRAPEPCHGKIYDIYHTRSSLFGTKTKDGSPLPNPVRATRYHSLIVERETLPECLEITAWTEDQLIMGLAHKSLPIHGVQFHPESIETHFGHELFEEFLRLSQK